MDVLAHGLWGGALFGRKTRWQWRWAFLVGMAPDIVAFGPFLVSQALSEQWKAFPPYVYSTYNITHSLVVWAAVAAALWAIRKRFPWILGAWALHVVCDIPLHELSFFPTPYLWPLPTPLVDGVRWAQPSIVFPNYVALAVTYTFLIAWRYRRQKAELRANGVLKTDSRGKLLG
jgi:hypothetical protein